MFTYHYELVKFRRSKKGYVLYVLGGIRAKFRVQNFLNDTNPKNAHKLLMVTLVALALVIYEKLETDISLQKKVHRMRFVLIHKNSILNRMAG